jgi:hypothetical protein
MMNISRVAWPPSNEKLISVIKYQQVKRERERERVIYNQRRSMEGA